MAQPGLDRDDAQVRPMLEAGRPKIAAGCTARYLRRVPKRGRDASAHVLLARLSRWSARSPSSRGEWRPLARQTGDLSFAAGPGVADAHLGSRHGVLSGLLPSQAKAGHRLLFPAVSQGYLQGLHRELRL